MNVQDIVNTIEQTIEYLHENKLPLSIEELVYAVQNEDARIPATTIAGYMHDTYNWSRI